MLPSIADEIKHMTEASTTEQEGAESTPVVPVESVNLPPYGTVVEAGTLGELTFDSTVGCVLLKLAFKSMFPITKHTAALFSTTLSYRWWFYGEQYFLACCG